MARPTQILCTDDKLRPRKAWVVPIASPHSPALWLSNAYLNANIGVGRRPGRRLQVRPSLRSTWVLSCCCYLFVAPIYLFICARWGEYLCGDPLCASRRQQAGQGEGPRQSRNKNLLSYINFDASLQRVLCCFTEERCDARCK